MPTKSNKVQLQEISYEGFNALNLSNNQIALTLIPELGAKIADIRHVPSQTPWLWKNPHLNYSNHPVYGDSYVDEFDLGGLDECFPTVAPSFFPTEPWAGTAIPDHGELWAQPWDIKIIEESDQKIVLSTSCYGVRLPYRFERTITLKAGQNTAKLDYCVSNLSPYPMPFLWCIHPLLRIKAGMRLSLPNEVTQIRINSSSNDFLGKLGTLQPWPQAITHDGQTIDLSQIQASSFAQTIKLFTLALTGDSPLETALTTANGNHSFRLRFSPLEITHIAIWMNYGGWGLKNKPPYYNLGLEPCIGSGDSLSVATNHWNEQGILEAKQNRTWSLEVIIT